MKFRNELFLGGHANLSLVSTRTGTSAGFVGCVGRLKVNNKQYDMRRGVYVGDVLYGVDVGRFLISVVQSTCGAREIHASSATLPKTSDALNYAA
jgi:hypothetical protein